MSATGTDAETELEEPIKIGWTGYARGRIADYNRDYSSDKSDRYTRTMDRQKTNVVIKTVEEAGAVYSELYGYSSDGRSWMNGSMDRSLSRVQHTVREEMEARGYTVEGDGAHARFTPSGGEDGA